MTNLTTFKTKTPSDELTTKLTRIWAPQRVDETNLLEKECVYYGLLRDDVYLEVLGTPERNDLCFSLHFHGNYLYRGSLAAYPTGDIETSAEDEEQAELAQVCARWLPLFRRNCWLCGCPIECSEHEKLEWSLWLQEQKPQRETLREWR